MSEWSPAQLDALEDALEDLESLGVTPEVGVAGGPDVARRLDEYREILQWTRAAMPLTEVTPGLLDGVLDEARSVTPIAVQAAVADEPARESWWKRLRGVFVVPVLAVAGSAALVLILVRPGAKEESTLAANEAVGEPAQVRAELKAAESPPANGPAGVLDKGLADASVDQELSRGRLRLEDAEPEEARGAAAAEQAPAPAFGPDDIAGATAPTTKSKPAAPPPPPPPPPPAKERANDKVIYEDGADRDDAQKNASGGAPGGGAAPPSSRAEPPKAPEPAAEPAPAEEKEPTAGDTAKKQKKDESAKDDAGDPWGAISAADSLRRSGNCASAKSRYKALSSAGDLRVRARALAGLGLCEERAGNQKGADGFYSKARKADPDISGFIAQERAPVQQAAPPSADALEDQSLE